jgi:uncharacterized membrane protein
LRFARLRPELGRLRRSRTFSDAQRVTFSAKQGTHSVFFSAVGGVIAFFESKLAAFLKRSESSGSFSTRALRIVTLITIYLAALLARTGLAFTNSPVHGATC